MLKSPNCFFTGRSAQVPVTIKETGRVRGEDIVYFDKKSLEFYRSSFPNIDPITGKVLSLEQREPYIHPDKIICDSLLIKGKRYSPQNPLCYLISPGPSFEQTTPEFEGSTIKLSDEDYTALYIEYCDPRSHLYGVVRKIGLRPCIDLSNRSSSNSWGEVFDEIVISSDQYSVFYDKMQSEIALNDLYKNLGVAEDSSENPAHWEWLALDNVTKISLDKFLNEIREIQGERVPYRLTEQKSTKRAVKDSLKSSLQFPTKDGAATQSKDWLFSKLFQAGLCTHDYFNLGAISQDNFHYSEEVNEQRIAGFTGIRR